MKIQRLGALEMIPPKCSCLLNVSFVINEEENCLYFILFQSLVDENFSTDIQVDMFIAKTANSLFNVGNLICVGSGDVFVVYCKDKGSQDLPPNNLYNPTLQSIEEHPVLSELKRNNRVLTINDKFHPRQVELLKKSCQQL